MYRIVSLCPSTTATLFDLNLAGQMIGRTKFCIEPAGKVDVIQKVGGTKTPKFDLIRSLNPTHILFNKEENDITQLTECESICQTVVTTPTDVQSSIEQNKIFGQLFGRESEATLLNKKIDALYQELKSKPFSGFSYLYFIWNKPYMVAGKGTYIETLLSLIGGQNAAANIGESRYPEVSKQQIQSLTADYAFLSSEPFPYKEKHIGDYRFAAKQVELVDGQLLSWHGSWTLKGLKYLQDLTQKL